MSTTCYRAPEVFLLKGNYSSEIDIWSCACVFFEMVSSCLLFSGDSDIDFVHRMFQYLGTPTKQEWPEIYEIDAKFNIFKKQTIYDHCPHLNLEPEGYDLLEVDSS